MYIIQVADLHIGSKVKCQETEIEIMSKGIEQIKERIPNGEKILVCVCGDVIDSKDLTKNNKVVVQERYAEAADLFRYMMKSLADDYDVKMQFCLGNHDVTHINEFVESIVEFDAGITKEKLEKGYFLEWEGTYYIFANSCHGGQYEYGSIDYKTLEKHLKELPKDKPKILILHHTVMSMYEKDASSIRNSAQLLSIIQNNNVIGILHGHIHGRESFLIGKEKCRIIGTGAFFSRNYPNVNSQFNIIELKPYVFKEISSYVYMADDRISAKQWMKISSDSDGDDNYFRGTSFEDVYKKLINVLAVKKVLNNVVLQINCSYTEFVSDLEFFLGNDKLCMGQKRYSYFELAEMWESITVPQSLYFNHGSYFKVQDEDEGKIEDVHAIQYIARQLKAKPTSNKAVLTTYDTSIIAQKSKGNEYFPSLLSIQFSLDAKGDTLYVHMYLRALEAERFLKINICEINWLVGRLKEQNVTFDKVDIAISAFRVQSKERFSCFLKADIDQKNNMELGFLVYEGNVTSICRMLNEKKDASETITNVSGIEALCQAMEIANNSSKSYQYSKKVINKLKETLSIYEKLDELHKRGSVKTNDEERYEQEIREKISEIVNDLKSENSRGDGET